MTPVETGTAMKKKRTGERDAELVAGMFAQAKPVSAPTTPSWREQDAQALEGRADYIMAAVIALERLDGMFVDRDELRTHVENTRNMLGVEETNLRARAQRMRSGE